MTFNYRIIFAFGLALLITLSGCGKKETPVSVEPTPVGPFTVAELADLNGAEEARFGVEYSVPDAAQKISFIKAYRTEFLVTNTSYDGYPNAVVLELTASSMENAQAAMANRRTAYLVDSMNRPYFFPTGYTLFHDPVTDKIYLVYETGTDIFDPKFRYLVIGSFKTAIQGKSSLFFDLGELSNQIDIAPFTPTQDMPDTEKLQEISDALAATANNDGAFKVWASIIDENKFGISFAVDGFEDKTKAIECAQSLYRTARSVLSEFGQRPDFFFVEFCVEQDEDNVVCRIVNPKVYRDPWEFVYQNMRTEESELFDLLPRPGSGSRSNYSDITLTEFNKIQDGDSYSRVKKIVGGDGELLSTSTILDTTYESYTWYGADGISNAIIFFSNGAVYSKSQYGLS